MPSQKKRGPITHPVKIDLGAGASLMTTIDPKTGLHWVQCEICRDNVKLTTKGNSHNYFLHRAACVTSGVRSAFDAQSLPLPSTSHLHTPSTINDSATATPVPTINHAPWSPLEHSDQNPSSETLPISLSNSLSDQNQCPGFIPEVKSVWDGYAYSAHRQNNLGWLPAGFTEMEQIILRADRCTRKAGQRKEPCSECLKVLNSKEFKQFLDRTQREPENLPINELTADQLCGLIRKQAKDMKTLRTKVSCFCRISGSKSK